MWTTIEIMLSLIYSFCLGVSPPLYNSVCKWMKLSIKLNLLQIGSRQLTPECKVCLLFASKQEKLMTCRTHGDVGRLPKYPQHLHGNAQASNLLSMRNKGAAKNIKGGGGNLRVDSVFLEGKSVAPFGSAYSILFYSVQQSAYSCIGITQWRDFREGPLFVQSWVQEFLGWVSGFSDCSLSHPFFLPKAFE